MKYFILAIVLVVVITVIVIYFIRKRWAIKKVKCLTDEEKLISLDAALNPFGFAFDLNCDIVVSRNDAWQRNFGYMDLYDKKAPFFNMVFDAEPICFDYDGKEYRIEFWKGQYGIITEHGHGAIHFHRRMLRNLLSRLTLCGLGLFLP
ncbi:MAG: DUF4474 domain-containing protein, partial [Bacilli bacterium]|nr:DUF4474 domain-containing protein [Bacilli bacterium]